MIKVKRAGWKKCEQGGKSLEKSLQQKSQKCGERDFCSISDEVRIEELKIFSKSQNDYAQIKVCSSEIYEIGTNMINYSVSAE